MSTPAPSTVSLEDLPGRGSSFREKDDSTPRSRPASPRTEEEKEKPSGGGFSFRGTGKKEEKDQGLFADPRLRALLTEREIRLSFSVLPTQFERFGDWWFQSESAILAAGPDPELTLLYLEELDMLTFERVVRLFAPDDDGVGRPSVCAGDLCDTRAGP
jgi:hypothetical protein